MIEKFLRAYLIPGFRDHVAVVRLVEDSKFSIEFIDLDFLEYFEPADEKFAIEAFAQKNFDKFVKGREPIYHQTLFLFPKELAEMGLKINIKLERI